jgi:hypothetical protein
LLKTESDEIVAGDQTLGLCRVLATLYGVAED